VAVDVQTDIEIAWPREPPLARMKDVGQRRTRMTLRMKEILE
jgi:hypothetical protein